MSRLRYAISLNNKENNMLSDQITYSKTIKITDFLSPGTITCLVGGGGKTSTMLQIAKELTNAKKDFTNVIMTTTTRIKPFAQPLPEGIHCVGIKKEEGKLGPVENPDALKKDCDYLLIEADGSRGKPVKVPADHEPVITENCDLVIAVMGLNGIGRPISEACHRIPQVCEFLKKKETDLLTEEDAARILSSENGLRKGVGKRRYAVILNQADYTESIQMGRRISNLLSDEITCILTSYEIERFVEDKTNEKSIN